MAISYDLLLASDMEYKHLIVELDIAVWIQHLRSTICFLKLDMAISYGLLWASNMGYKHLIVESDIAVLIQHLRSTVWNLSSLGALTEDILSLGKIFESCRFIYVPSEENKGAQEKNSLIV